MISIIGWALLVCLHIHNLQAWKDEPKSFWYKSSWFFIGFSIACLINAIGAYVSN
jgi:hypothetical protein